MSKQRLYKFAVCGAILLTAAVIWAQLSRQRVYFETNFHTAGENLLHAVPTPETVLNMPLSGLVISLARYHSPLGPEGLGAALSLLTYLVLFGIGAAGGGLPRGLLFAGAGALINLPVKVLEVEQLIYTPLLLLYAGLEYRRVKGDLAAAAAAGLALGLTLITRSPLFLFPPLLLAWRRLSGEKDPRAEAVFLFFSYVLLLPWLGLTRALTGGFQLFEGERVACILITGAQGGVFAPIASECRAFAGIAPDANIYAWAFGTVLHSPLVYAAGLLRRLWQASLMLPGFLLLAAVAFPLKTKEEKITALLAGYFLLLHCLLALEERYLYPLRYLLLVLGLSGAWRRLAAGTEPSPWGGRVLNAALALAAAAGLAASALVINLQLTRRSPDEAVERALAKYPGDAWLLEKRAELRRYSGKPWRAPPAGSGPENLYSVKLAALTASLETGDVRTAGRRFEEIKKMWETGRNGLRAAPYALDREMDARIRAANLTLWDTDLYGALLGYPPARRPGMIAALGKITALTPKLRYLAVISSPPSPAATDELLGLMPGTALPEWLDAREAAARLLPAALAAAPRCAKPQAGRDAQIISAMETELRENPAVMFTRYQPDLEKAGRADALALAGVLRGLKSGAPGTGQELPDKTNPVYAWLSFRLGGCKTAGAGLFGDYAAAAAADYYAGKNLKKEAASLLSTLEPERADPRTALLAALALQELGDYARGLRFAGRALELNGKNPEALNQRGVLLMLSGDKDGAAGDFRAALGINRAYFQAAMNLGTLLAAEGRARDAALAYGQALGAKDLPEGARLYLSAYLEKAGGADKK